MLCALSYKRVCKHCNTGPCARVCMCHARRTEVWVIQVRLKYQVEVGPDWIPSDRSPDFEKHYCRVSAICSLVWASAKHLMHMEHKSVNTSGVSKSSSDLLNYTGFPGDVCVAFFYVPPGNKDAVRRRQTPSWKKKAVVFTTTVLSKLHFCCAAHMQKKKNSWEAIWLNSSKKKKKKIAILG